MTKNPYNNEPGYEQFEDNNVNCVQYAGKIRHETIRISIINACQDIIDNNDMYFNNVQLLTRYKKIIPSIIEECIILREKYPDEIQFHIESFEYGGNQANGKFMYSFLITQLINLDAKLQAIL